MRVFYIAPIIPEDIGYDDGHDFVTKAESHQRYCHLTEQLGYEVEFAYLSQEFESYGHPEFGHQITGFPVSFKLPYMEISLPLLRYLWTEDIDLIYLNTFYSHRMLPILLVLRLSGTPVILHHHGDEEPAFRFELQENAVKILLKGLPSQVFAVNLAVADHLRETGIKNVDHLAHGIDTEMFAPMETEKASEKAGFTHDSLDLLFVGRIKKIKGVPELLEAVERLKNDYPRLQLHLVYAGADEDALAEAKEFVSSADLGDSVHFVGAVDRTNLREYYASADICVFPSVREGFGMVPAEAMSCASATIVTTVHKRAGHNVVNGHNSLVIESGSVPALVQAIEELLNDPVYREQLGRNARRTVEENYSWGAIQNTLEETFTRLTSRE